MTTVLPKGETEFAGQAAQSPVPDPYVPALQTQYPDTGIVEIESLPHNIHVKPSPRKPSLQVVHTSVTTTAYCGIIGHPVLSGRHVHTQTPQ